MSFHTKARFWLCFLVIFQITYGISYSDSTSVQKNSPAEKKGRRPYGIAMMQPLLIAKSKKDMWIVAAFEERFHTATVLSKRIYVPDPQQLYNFSMQCPPRQSGPCKEILMQRLMLQWMIEIRVKRSEKGLLARITLHAPNSDTVSEHFYHQTDGDKPFEFVASTLEKAFLHAGVLSPQIKKRLYQFPTQNTDVYGCYVMGYRHFIHKEFEQAYYPLQRSLELAPRFLPALFLMARTHLAVGQINEAAQLITQTEGIPTSWDMDLAIAEVLRKQGQTSAAFQKLKQAEKKLPHPVAVCEFAIGDYYLGISAATRGISHLINAINLNPSALHYYFVLGLLYCQNKDYASAIPHFQKLIRLDPNTKKYRLHLGIAFRENQEPGRAVEVFESLLREYPNYHSARINLALTYLKIGWQQKAANLLEANAKIYRDTLHSFMNLALLKIDGGNVTLGASWLKMVLKKYPDNFNTLVNLGLAEIKLKNFSDAEGHLKKAEKMKSTDVVLLMGLSTLYNRLKDEQKEFHYLNRVLEINPENIPALTRLAEHSIETKDIPEAINYLIEIVSLDAAAYRQRLMLGECLMNEADTENAQEHFGYIESTFSDSPYIQLQLVRSLIRCKLLAKAVLVAERQLEKGQRIAEFHQVLGIAFASQLIYGQNRRLNAESLALTHLSQAANIDKNNWRTYFWLGRYYKSIKRDNYTANQHFEKALSIATPEGKKLIEPYLTSEAY